MYDRIMHQSIPPVPRPPPGLLRGICTPCQSRGLGICKFCTARGPGICQPQGHSQGFDTHAVSYQNITTQKVLLEKKTNIMMRRWNHNVILFRSISRFLSAMCRRWFPGQSGDRTCLVLYKRLVICFARPFQLLPSACTSDIPLTLS